MRIFLAGASGVVGRRLVPLLVGAGHQVTGTTRSLEKAEDIARAGAAAAVVDVFDAPALTRAVAAAKPDVVIHQLTDLPDVFDRDRMAAAGERNSRIRIEGTANLVAAARAAGARRMVAQSIAFIYAPGPEPHQESDALMSDREGEGAVTARGVLALERLVTATPGLDGIVLRYGRFYGPGTWRTEPGGRGYLHVDAAAQAALLAVTKGSAGIYNIAEDDGEVAIAKARRELGFDPALRLGAAS
jgi:nucleoside-diphosphate-sugar epimerase